MPGLVQEAAVVRCTWRGSPQELSNTELPSLTSPCSNKCPDLVYDLHLRCLLSRQVEVGAWPTAHREPPMQTAWPRKFGASFLLPRAGWALRGAASPLEALLMTHQLRDLLA